MNDYLTTNEIHQLEEWTSLKCGAVLFDSNNDNWNRDTSVFCDKIIGKKQMIFLIEDTDGEKFGYYLDTEIKNHYSNGLDKRISTNKKSRSDFSERD